VIASAEGPGRDAPFRRTLHSVVDQYLKDLDISEPPRPPGLGVKAEDAMRQVGFQDVHTEDFNHEIEWDIPRFLGFMKSWSRMAHFNTDQLGEIDLRASKALFDLAGGGTFREPCRTHAILGTKG
jgi:hypothetical protein